MTLSTFIGSALAAALILTFIWWLMALNHERQLRWQELTQRNDRIDAHYLRNLEAARRIGVPVDDLEKRGRGV